MLEVKEGDVVFIAINKRYDGTGVNGRKNLLFLEKRLNFFRFPGKLFNFFLPFTPAPL